MQLTYLAAALIAAVGVSAAPLEARAEATAQDLQALESRLQSSGIQIKSTANGKQYCWNYYNCYGSAYALYNNCNYLGGPGICNANIDLSWLGLGQYNFQWQGPGYGAYCASYDIYGRCNAAVAKREAEAEPKQDQAAEIESRLQESGIQIQNSANGKQYCWDYYNCFNSYTSLFNNCNYLGAPGRCNANINLGWLGNYNINWQGYGNGAYCAQRDYYGNCIAAVAKREAKEFEA